MQIYRLLFEIINTCDWFCKKKKYPVNSNLTEHGFLYYRYLSVIPYIF